MSSPTLRQLELFIDDTYNLEEFEDLCLQLDVKYEDIRGDTLRGKSLALVKYMKNRGRLGELTAVLEQERLVNYQAAFGSSESSPSPEAGILSTKAGQADTAGRKISPWVWVAAIGLIATLIVWVVVNATDRPGSAGTAGSTPGAAVAPNAAVTVAASPVASFIHITQPMDGDEVGREVTIQGELAGDVCEGCQLYAFVHPLRSQPNYYYLQQDSQTDLSEALFTVTGVVVGGETVADNGKQFEIWVVISSEIPSEANLNPQEWLAFQKQAAEFVTVIRVEL